MIGGETLQVPGSSGYASAGWCRVVQALANSLNVSRGPSSGRCTAEPRRLPIGLRFAARTGMAVSRVTCRTRRHCPDQGISGNPQVNARVESSLAVRPDRPDSGTSPRPTAYSSPLTPTPAGTVAAVADTIWLGALAEAEVIAPLVHHRREDVSPVTGEAPLDLAGVGGQQLRGRGGRTRHPATGRLTADCAMLDDGTVAERTKATALKVVDPQGSVGSNPTRSAATDR